MAMFTSYVCLPEGTQFWEIKGCFWTGCSKIHHSSFCLFLSCGRPKPHVLENSEQATGWWYTYPSEKYELVRWDDDIPNWTEIHKSRVPNHQPDISLTIINHY